MSKRGENIYKRKDGRWEGRYIKGRTTVGKAVYGYVYARSYKDVRLKLQNAVYLQQSMPNECLQIKEQSYFSILTEEWLNHIRPLTKESTYRKYCNLWKSYICPELGSIRYADITLEVLEGYCRKLLSSGGQGGTGLSSKTVSDSLSLINSIFCFYSNRKIPMPCNIKKILVKNPAKEMRVFSLKEQQTICDYIYSNLCIRNAGILVCLFTGIRIGEVCALKWEDISLTEKTIHIHQTMQRIQTDAADGPRTKIIITTPKSRCSIRTIPIQKELVEVLQIVKNSDLGYFLTGNEKQWVEPRTMQNHFKRVLKQCDIKDANYHTLRHTFATRCIEREFDVKSLSEILGHASVSITMNRYVHPSMQLKQANMQRLSDLLTMK